MVSTFFLDLDNARGAERLVMQQLQALLPQYTLESVGNQREYFHKGDIRAVDNESGEAIFIEVKDDGRIADTRNVLCEEMVFYNTTGFAKGNMYSDYEIYAVVSKPERKIYVLDFDIMRNHYKSGTYKVIPHREQTTYCYLMPLAQLRALGALLAEIDY